MGYSTPTKNTTTINHHIKHPLIRKSSTALTVDYLSSTSTPSFTTLYNNDEHETEERKKKITVDDNGSVFIPNLSANSATNEKMIISIDDIPDLPFDMMSFSSSTIPTQQHLDGSIPSSESDTAMNDMSTKDNTTTADTTTTQPRSSRLLKSTTNNNATITSTEIKERNEARRRIRLSLHNNSPFSSAAVITQCMVGMVLISSLGVDEA